MRRVAANGLGICAAGLLLGMVIAPAQTVRKQGSDLDHGGLAAAASGIPADLRQAVEKAQYRIRAQKHAGAYRASNPAQELRANFSGAGVSVAPSTDGAWQWGLSLRSYGYGERVQAVGQASLRALDNRLEYRRGALSEWYVNQRQGIEQGFTLATPPGERRAGEPLVMRMAVSGDLMAQARADGKQVDFTARGGERVLHYSEPAAFDAKGRPLTARLSVVKSEVRLAVDDRDAVYPLTIDPVIGAETKLTASDPSANGYFGASVGMSGNTAVVGASGKNNSAYVFVRTAGDWTEQAELFPSDSTGNSFGGAAAMDGDTIVVGAPDFSNVTAGAVYVFVRSGTTWSQQAELLDTTLAAGSEFGNAVAISGDTLIAGTSPDQPGTTPAYVFVRNGTAWSQQAQLSPSDPAAGDEFGSSVAISGDTAIIGDPDAGALINQGLAYVFMRTGTAWSQQAELSASDPAASDEFGSSVAISGDTAIIGTPFHTAGSSSAGSAYVFARSGTAWDQQAELSASDAASGDRFGSSVAISGNAAIIGARLHAISGSSYAGSAYVFALSGMAWSQVAELSASDAAARDTFGTAVAIGGGTVFAGAPFATVSGVQQAGAAYTYDVALPISVTIGSVPSGLPFTVTGDGCAPGSYVSPQTLAWTSGSSCTVAFDSSQTSSGLPYRFINWSDGGSAVTPRTFTVPQNSTTYMANFGLITNVAVAPVSGPSGASVALNAMVGPAGGIFTGFLQFQVAGVPAGPQIGVTGPGLYTTPYKITQSVGSQSTIAAILTPSVLTAIGSSGQNTLTVTPPATNFTIAPLPPTETAIRGIAAAFLLQLKSVNGFNGTVKLSCSGGPVGAKCADLPQSVKVNGTALALSGILFPKTTAPGIYTVIFTGVSGSLSNSATATFTVK